MVFKINKNGSAVFIFALFLINPLFGILSASLSAYLSKKDHSIKVLMVLLMLYLGALNTTKVPYSDMINYLEMYEMVPWVGYKGTLSYLSFYSTGGIKDIGYSTLVYLLYYATFGNQKLFIFIITVLGYWFMYMSIYKFGKQYKIKKYLWISQVLILSFFIQYFSLTFHLVRQILATSIFFYALTFRNTSFWKYLLFCFLAANFHSAVSILIVFSILPVMKRKLKLLEIGGFMLFAAFCVVILSTVASFMIETADFGDSIEGNLGKVAGMEGAQDSTTGVRLFGFIFSILTIVICMLERVKGKFMLYPVVVNEALVVSCMILGLSASPLVQYRFFFYLYSFFPFILPLLLRNNILVSKAMCLVVISFFVVMFYARLNHIYEFVPVEEALFYPYFSLIQLV